MNTVDTTNNDDDMIKKLGFANAPSPDFSANANLALAGVGSVANRQRFASEQEAYRRIFGQGQAQASEERTAQDQFTIPAIAESNAKVEVANADAGAKVGAADRELQGTRTKAAADMATKLFPDLFGPRDIYAPTGGNTGGVYNEKTGEIKTPQTAGSGTNPVTGLMESRNANGSLEYVVGRDGTVHYPPAVNPMQAAMAGQLTPPGAAAPGATGAPVTPDIAQSLLKEAGGDKEKARALAKQRGYTL